VRSSALLLLLLLDAPAFGTVLGARHCADAAARQMAMRHIVLGVPQLGFSAIQAQEALESLDTEWKRAFGDTATQPRYQEAVEDYASRVRRLVEVALRSKDDKDVPIALLESARRDEALAYSRLEEQAHRACPMPQG
jgi:hypothetical protein